MAPTLLGHHRELTCPNCGLRLRGRHRRGGPAAAGGLPELRQERPRRRCRRSSATATGCWSRSSSTTSAAPGAGRSRSSTSRASRPRPTSSAWSGCPASRSRSSTATSSSTGRSPGRSLAEIRAMRILVHDSRFVPRDADRFPRWVVPSGARRRAGSPAAGARRTAGSCTQAEPTPGRDPDDWLVYRHWDPGREPLRPDPRLLRLQRRRPAARRTRSPTWRSRRGCR